MPFYCSSAPRRTFYGSMREEFFRITAANKLKISLILANGFKSDVKTKWANEENQVFLNDTHREKTVFY